MTPSCRRRRPNGRFYHRELMQNRIRFRLSRKPHGRSIIAEYKRKRTGNFTLDTTNPPHTPRNTRGSKNKCTLLYAKGPSAQPDMFWRTHQTKPDPKSIRVMPLCLCTWTSINQTRATRLLISSLGLRRGHLYTPPPSRPLDRGWVYLNARAR